MCGPFCSARAGLLGLYGLYLLYVGLPVMMGSPTNKSLGYTVVVMLCTVVLSTVVAFASAFLLSTFMPGDPMVPATGTASAA